MDHEEAGAVLQAGERCSEIGLGKQVEVDTVYRTNRGGANEARQPGQP